MTLEKEISKLFIDILNIYPETRYALIKYLIRKFPQEIEIEIIRKNKLK